MQECRVCLTQCIIEILAFMAELVGRRAAPVVYRLYALLAVQGPRPQRLLKARLLAFQAVLQPAAINTLKL